MKKGYTLIELMLVIVIMGILAAVTVPKFFGMMCASDMDRCKVERPEDYKFLCENNEDNKYRHADLKEKIHNHCYGNTKHSNNSEQTIPVVENNNYIVVHDTVKMIDTVYMDQSEEACIKKCTENNKSQSVINFCIKEECKKN